MASPASTAAPPLTGVRVVDLAEGPYQGVGRYLADLGADVIRVEPAGGSADRSTGTVSAGTSLTFAIANANKSGLTLDIDTGDGRAALARLAAGAEIVLVSAASSFYTTGLFDRETARREYPATTVVVLSDFGLTGPKAGWTATPAVHLALSSVLSRSGLPSVAEPLLPPEFLVYGSANVQALWTTMVAYGAARRGGHGEYVDFSVQQALMHTLDPVAGMGGTARPGQTLLDVPRGRPDAGHLYPIFPVADGYVRMCILAPRQWYGMFRWLGEPERFADEQWSQVYFRNAHAAELYPAIAEMLAGKTRVEAVAEGQALGVAIAALDDLGAVLRQPAFREGGDLVDVDLPDGRRATIPAPLFELDGVRGTFRKPAPAPGEPAGTLPDRFAARPEVTAARGTAPAAGGPFSGLKVLDLGVIIVGAEVGRVLADHGADVIKVESRSAPDGARVSVDGSGMSAVVAWGHSNKRSVGIDLKTGGGRELFARLVEQADVVLTNFKPGTLEKLGIDYDSLAAINPRIILSESSAFGNTGPWSQQMGYGPLVRAASGLSGLWRYPESDDSFSDGITVYPDHVAGRFNAAAIAALLMRRERTGRGGRVSVAQVDAIFAAMADNLALESVEPGSVTPPVGVRTDAPVGLFPCAGEDEWIVIDGAGDHRFRRLATAIGRTDWLDDPGLASAESRLGRAAELKTALRVWAAGQDPVAAEATLQNAGVPAGHMARVREHIADDQLAARGAFGELTQPQLDGALPAVLGEAPFSEVPVPPRNPAPLQAEHTYEVLRDFLGLDDAAINAHLDAGHAEVHPGADRRPPATA